MKLGAADFIEKPYDPPELLGAISQAIATSRERPLQQDAIREARRQLRTLTERESEVVDAIVAGLSSRQIAEAFSVSQRTVEAHRANVLSKLGLSNTASLVRLAVLAGLGAPQE
jgi:two-component system response regulator FixJ